LDIALAQYFLPSGILDYFDIISHKIEQEKVDYLVNL